MSISDEVELWKRPKDVTLLGIELFVEKRTVEKRCRRFHGIGYLKLKYRVDAINRPTYGIYSVVTNRRREYSRGLVIGSSE